MKKFLISAFFAASILYTSSYQANATPPAYDIFVLSCGSVQVEFDFEPSTEELLYYYDLLEEMFCG